MIGCAVQLWVRNLQTSQDITLNGNACMYFDVEIKVR
jgi:hypothetical protein